MLQRIRQRWGLWLIAAGVLLGVLAGTAQVTRAQADAVNEKPADKASDWVAGRVIVNGAVRHDQSAPLPELVKAYQPLPPQEHRHPTNGGPREEKPSALTTVDVGAASAAVEQTAQQTRAAATEVASFDGLGVGFSGPQGTAETRNPSDNSLAVGPDEIVQIVNSRMAIYTKKGRRYAVTGKPLLGPVVTNSLFAKLGGPCENLVSGDAVVRYDQLANRWLFVLPIFRRPADQPDAPYAMCYAVSAGPDLMGRYYRYEFSRPLFPDYPRPAIWSDGYYVPTSTGDTVIQKQVCTADRKRMLAGLPASEQCMIVDGVNFLNCADIDGRRLPPAGTPEIVMAAGGTQLHEQFEDDGIYAWQYSVNWDDPSKTHLTGPEKISVAPYRYLCNGQLSKCVPQPGTDVRLDAQGDKLMQRLAYRNFGGHQSIVATHSIDTKTGGGGVRWYEFRLDTQGKPQLFQQGTYAPDANYRWMGSIAMDRKGDIGVGYSFGGRTSDPGQRFTARLAGDTKGQMTLQEAMVAEGRTAQKNTLRWEDYTTLVIDPSDDCTFWYVGDYLKTDAENYSTRIGGYRLPGCRGKVRRFGFF